MTNTMIEALIREWALTTEGTSVARTHASLVAAFAGIDPSKPGQYSLDMLLAEGLAEVTYLGEYVLTAKGCERRKSLGGDYVAPEKTDESGKPGNPLEWARFKKMLAYYRECVRRQSSGKDYLYHTDNGYKYLVPNLGYNWLKPVDQDSPVNTIVIRSREAVAQGYLHSVGSERKLYIGYPIEAFEYNGKTLYTPIGLIPVEIVGGSKTTLDLQLYHRDASLNPYWLDFHVPKHEKSMVYNSILNIHKDDEYYGTIDLLSALDWIKNYSKDKPNLDPNLVDFFLPILQKGESKLRNTPILFAAQDSTYTKTLMRELEQIGNEAPEVLDKTALAYVFREHVLPYERASECVAIPFIDSNDEQRQAVTESLNKPITRVTGPPGTGKSQVAVNIIANLVYRGKSVLFTSKNHKAVCAIADRSRKVSPNLVNFCSSPDGKTSNPWYERNLDMLQADAQSNFHPENSEAGKMLSLAEKRILEIEERFAKRNGIIKEINDSRIAKETKEVLLDQYIDGHGSPAGSDIEQLKMYAKTLKEAPVWKWTISSFFEWLSWKCFDQGIKENSLKWLETHYPALFRYGSDLNKVKSRISEYVQEAESYLQACQQYNKACEEAKELPEIGQEDVDTLDKQLKLFQQKKDAALEYALTQPLAELDCDDARFIQLKNLAGFFKKRSGHYDSTLLKESEIQEAKSGVRNFLKCVPAWAATMLSLKKASPCISGVFDHVIIDEASQCDIPPMIPALFRAKCATIIGDPQQFPPVRDIPNSIHSYLMHRYNISEVDDMRFTYIDHSAYDMPLEKPVLLQDHYRCHSDIAAFSNEEYYQGKLNICTNENVLKNPKAFGLERAFEWVDIKDGTEAELQAIEQHLQLLVDRGYEGSVGVITPFRHIADRMAARFQKFEGKLSDFLVNTANGFQGGERDLIIFATSYNALLTKGQKWYSESDDNRYIYNVAVSRARACLLVVGDRERCRQSGIRVLQALAEHPKEQKRMNQLPFDSVWEEKLYEALKKEGIVTLPQFRLANRRLDMAYLSNVFRLDIEVDGVRYHATEEYGRKADDVYRDLQMRSLGWAVQRFWVYELEKDMDACVALVKKRIRERR